MRFVLAIVSLVASVFMIGIGIAYLTFLAGPDQVTASSSRPVSTAVTIIDGTALTAYQHTQSIDVSGTPTIFAAYGRTSDVLAWIGDTAYTRVTYSAKSGVLLTNVHSGKATTVPSAAGSDLWFKEFTGTGSLRLHLNVPRNVSVIILSDGVSPAPSNISVTWPLNNAKPWAGPLILGGGALALVGLSLLLWALAHMRKTRGPRRTPQKKMPKLPRQPRIKQRTSPKAIAAPKGRRALHRTAIAFPVLLAGALVLSACSAGAAPGLPASSPGAPAIAAAKAALETPAVTEPQAARIIQSISALTARADTNLDPALLATRFAGPALDARLANYTVRKKDPKIPAQTPIPSGPVGLTLPQQSDTWPRTVFAVVGNQNDTTVAPMALMLVQDDPRSNYKVQYTMSLEPGVVLPKVAAASIGAARLPADIKIFQMQPATVAAAYGDILLQDEVSSYYSLFEAKGDTLRTQVGLQAKQALRKKLPRTAKLIFSNAAGPGQVIVLATNDSGAIVAVQLNETETVKPDKPGAAVNPTGAIKLLSGKAISTKGITATYGDQLLFYIPSSSAKGKIILLGFSQGLIAAKELK